MAHRRCFSLLRPLLSPKTLTLNPQTLIPKTLIPIPKTLDRHFSSDPRRPPSSNDHYIFSGGDDDDEDDANAKSNPKTPATKPKVKSVEQKLKEARFIGYTVVGQLDLSTEMPFKPWEPVYAVIKIGSIQFKVSNGDCLFVEKLKYAEVNDKLILHKVLMLGSRTRTIIGRPLLSDAAVHAVVEEHAKDATVIIFKKKRRKHYRRCNGHRQQLTKLRITDIQGIEKIESPESNPSESMEEKLDAIPANAEEVAA